MSIITEANKSADKLKAVSRNEDGFLILATDGSTLFFHSDSTNQLLASMILSYMIENPELGSMVKSNLNGNITT